jgi:EAL domain-containing protein (putative c-di-GMP-specific phosphodiesterase class I)
VTNLRSSSEEAAIIEVIITIADRLNLVVIAEGVETIQERDALKALGCHCFQGYLFFKPLPVKEFEQVLQKRLSQEGVK